MYKPFAIPAFLHEVLGEQQSWLEITVILLFTALGTTAIYLQFIQTESHIAVWKVVIAFVIVADILAGFIANFTRGTNDFYAARPKNRLIFIAIHIHLLLVAWLTGADLFTAAIVWLVTIICALVVNALADSLYQRVIAACLLGMGLILLLQLTMPTWLLLVSVFFMAKVMFSFAVNHYAT